MHCRIIALLVGLFLTDLLTAADRPNIVWLLSEDNSIHYMQHYGSPHGATPAISQLAEEGITFNHAFSNSPVCSVCLLYTSPSPRDVEESRMPSSA